MKVMTHRCLACLAAISVSLAARSAAAEGSSEPPPAAVSAPAAAPVRNVRLNIRGYDGNKTPRIYLRAADDSYTLICAVPCSVDVPAGSDLRATWGGNDSAPHTFRVPGDARGEMNIEVRPANRGPLAVAIVVVASGALAALTGVVLQSRRREDLLSACTPALIGFGAAATAAGVLLIVFRDKKPRVHDTQSDLPLLDHGRAATVLGDVAAARPRDAWSTSAGTFIPLAYGFTF